MNVPNTTQHIFCLMRIYPSWIKNHGTNISHWFGASDEYEHLWFMIIPFNHLTPNEKLVKALAVWLMVDISNWWMGVKEVRKHRLVVAVASCYLEVQFRWAKWIKHDITTGTGLVLQQTWDFDQPWFDLAVRNLNCLQPQESAQISVWF